MTQIILKRGTHAQVAAAAALGGLALGTPYLLTDQNRIAVGLGPETFVVLPNLGDIPATKMVQELLTSGTTWDAPENLVGGAVKYRMVGGGGSGAVGSTTRGTAGGHSGYSEGVANVTPGDSYTYQVGVGGIASATGGGGTSSTMFGATAGGGLGDGSGSQIPTSNTMYQKGGTASGGNINVPGSTLMYPNLNVVLYTAPPPFGTSALSSGFGSPVALASTGYGAGGLGGTSAEGTAHSGRPGLIVLEYLVSA